MVEKKKMKRPPGTIFWSKKKNPKTKKWVKFVIRPDGRSKIIGHFQYKI